VGHARDGMSFETEGGCDWRKKKRTTSEKEGGIEVAQLKRASKEQDESPSTTISCKKSKQTRSKRMKANERSFLERGEGGQVHRDFYRRASSGGGGGKSSREQARADQRGGDKVRGSTRIGRKLYVGKKGVEDQNDLDGDDVHAPDCGLPRDQERHCLGDSEYHQIRNSKAGKSAKPRRFWGFPPVEETKKQRVQVQLAQLRSGA